jgi:hypothetical protein
MVLEYHYVSSLEKLPSDVQWLGFDVLVGLLSVI